MSTIEQDSNSDTAARTREDSELTEDTAFFSLFCDIFSGRRLSEEVTGFIKDTVPASCCFFIIRDSSMVWSSSPCPVTPERIREMIPSENIGIFTRQITGAEHPREPRGNLSAAFLGEDGSGHKLAAGLISPGKCSELAADEPQAWRLLSKIRNCYSDGISSRTLRDFASRTRAFRYALDAVTHEIAAKRLPEGKDSNTDTEQLDRQVSERLLPQILRHDAAAANRIERDTSFCNLRISRCRILNREYILLSFTMDPRSIEPAGEVARLIDDFTHKARGKLSAIQAAASQLALEKGSIIDDGDIRLASIIQSSVSVLDGMLDNLERHGRRPTRGTPAARLSRTAERAVINRNTNVDIVRRMAERPYQM
jgi:hypothetical protein